MSLLGYLRSEVTREYVLEHDQQRYTEKREKMYTFGRIPRELEKFMSYGFFHCLDSFLFIYTFLPLRVLSALFSLFFRPILILFGVVKSYNGRYLNPAEIIDLIKGLIIACCSYAMSYVDTSMLYHIIKSQSVIKLYLFYNMVEVADRLFSAFGQDTLDALFWTATEPRGKKREHIGMIPHFLIAVVYVFLHAMLVLLQATTLNVAVNASNKALLTIMMSNNFVELKGSVFKKFDKNNLFQVSCSDVRERFHLFVLMFVVVVQTMKEYGWREDSFWSLAPDCLTVLGAEILVDWVKHAFITRFNGISADVYKDYTISLAHDLALTKQKHAYSDHSDIVSRRMGFIPIPLGVVMLRVVYTAVKCRNPGTIAVVAMAYLCLLTFRVLGSIVILGKAADLIEEHITKDKKKDSTSEMPKESKKEETSAREEGMKMQNGSVVEDVKSGNSSGDFVLPEIGDSGQNKFVFQNSFVDRIDTLLPDSILPSNQTSTPQPDSCKMTDPQSDPVKMMDPQPDPVKMVDSGCQVEVTLVHSSATQMTPEHQPRIAKPTTGALNEHNLVVSPLRNKTTSESLASQVEFNTRPSDKKSSGPSSQENLVTKHKLYDANLEIPPFGQTNSPKTAKINPLRDLEIPPFVKSTPTNIPLSVSTSPFLRKFSPISPSLKSEDEHLSTSPKSVHWASDDDNYTFESKEEFYVDPSTLGSPHNLMSIGDLYATADRFMLDETPIEEKSKQDETSSKQTNNNLENRFTPDETPTKQINSNLENKFTQDETPSKQINSNLESPTKQTNSNLDNATNANSKNLVDNVSFLDSTSGVGLSPAGKAMSLSSPDLMQRLNKEDSDWPRGEESSDEEQLVAEDGELFLVSQGVRCRKKLPESSDGEGTQVL